jgi:ABC-type uncharacterized transport system substrate-binding protein
MPSLRLRGETMKRRDFITLLGRAFVAWPLSGHAQQAAPPLIGFLSSTRETAEAGVVAALRQGLNERGLSDGKAVSITYRWSEGDYSKLPQLAADLIDKKVNVIVASGLPAALAAKAATSTIPIVFRLASKVLIARVGISRASRCFSIR